MSAPALVRHLLNADQNPNITPTNNPPPISSAGIFMLKSPSDRGLKTVIFEAGSGIGGTWCWNCHPGAAVDSGVPEHEFSFPDVWKTWNWDTNYPNYQDLRRYFDHVDKVFGIKKDCAFNMAVVGGTFGINEGRWYVQTEDGLTSKTKYLVLRTGFVSLHFYTKEQHNIALFLKVFRLGVSAIKGR